MKDKSKKKRSAVGDSHRIWPSVFSDGGEDRATRVNVGMRDHLATKGTWAIKRNFSIRRRHLTRISQLPPAERRVNWNERVLFMEGGSTPGRHLHCVNRLLASAGHVFRVRCFTLSGKEFANVIQFVS